ncbi:MAG: hypothetical protein WCO65_03045 [bacterium]
MSELIPKYAPSKESKKPGVFSQIANHITGIINQEGRIIDGIFLGKDAAAKEKAWIPQNNTPASSEKKSVSTKEKREEEERQKIKNFVDDLKLLGYDENLKKNIDHAIAKKEEELSEFKIEFDIVKDEYDSLEKEIAYAKIDFYNSELDERKEKKRILDELNQKFEPIKKSYDEMKNSIRRLEKGVPTGSIVGDEQEEIIDSMSISELKKLSQGTRLAQVKEYFFNIAKNKFNIPEGDIVRNKLGNIVSFRLGDEGIPFEKEMKKMLDAYLASAGIKN